MRKLLWLAVLLGTVCGYGLFALSPAQADTTNCSIINQGVPHRELRGCTVMYTPPGAEFDGEIIWHYIDNKNGAAPAPYGDITGDLYDTSDDGSCARLVLQRYDVNGNPDTPITWISACGKGAHTKVGDNNGEFNVGDPQPGSHYTTGTYKWFLETNSLTTHVWTQTISDKQP